MLSAISSARGSTKVASMTITASTFHERVTPAIGVREPGIVLGARLPSEPVSRSSLSPLRFLLRSADVWRDRPAIRSGTEVEAYSAFLERVQRACGALHTLGIREGDRIATLLPNIGAMLELHYAVPGTGGVLVPLNTRLSPAEYSYILAHSGARVVMVEESLRPVLDEALHEFGHERPVVLTVRDDGRGDWDDLRGMSPPAELVLPADEDALLSINYTSGTTGRPKGVMTTHRGAYLHSLGVVAEAGLSTVSRYLWTLPMFHCNGWAYVWAVTAGGALHVTLPRVDPAQIWSALLVDGVSHLCAAPTVLTMIIEAPQARPCPRPVRVFVGGAPPAPTLLERAEHLGIEVIHLYGLTETYGPIAVCAWNPTWDDLPPQDRMRLRARQGVATVVSDRLRVVDDHVVDVPADGRTLGEIVMRGNNVMLGYYRDPDGTDSAFRGGWFHSGDLAVMHPDGYVEIRDRLKDVIISGGENISSVEVEQAVLAHPGVVEAAVVAAPDERWGEVPVAFVTARDGVDLHPEEIRSFVSGRLARFKIPRRIEIVSDLPKTGTGKIQKFSLRERLR